MLEMINQRYMKFLFLISRRPRNISKLAKIGDFTLSVTSTLISRWAREGVVLKQKSEGGKEIIIALTEYGKAQVKLLKELNQNHLKEHYPEKEKPRIIDKVELVGVALVKDPLKGQEITNITNPEVKNDNR